MHQKNLANPFQIQTLTPIQIILSTETAREVSKNMHPIAKIGDSSDIIPVIKWLLSPEAKWVTGQTIHVDGGLSTVKPR